MKVVKDISIKNVRDFYSDIKKELEKEGKIEIDFTGVSRIDASIAQVILSAFRKAEETGKDFEYTGVTPELKKFLKLSGIE